MACTVFLSDGFTYLVASLMAIIAIGIIRANRSIATKMTRWAKSNPKKTQVIITGLQFILMGLGLFTGYNLKKLGFEFSDVTAYVFSIIMGIGFLSVPFFPKRESIAIPREVEKYRAAYLSIALSMFVIITFTGNRIGDVYPNSPITQALEEIDKSIFPDLFIQDTEFNEDGIGVFYNHKPSQTFADESYPKAVFAVNPVYKKESIDESIFPDKIKSRKDLRKLRKAKRKANRKARKELRKKFRLALAGGSCVLAIFLIVLLSLLVCAGVCLVVLGFMALFGGGLLIGLAAVFAGPFAFWGGIKGIKNVSKWCRDGD